MSSASRGRVSLQRRGSSRWWAGRPSVFVGNVSWPTMTVYSPHGEEYESCGRRLPRRRLSDSGHRLEGTEVCDWLTSKVITSVLLKYRVPGDAFYPKSAPTGLTAVVR